MGNAGQGDVVGGAQLRLPGYGGAAVFLRPRMVAARTLDADRPGWAYDLGLLCPDRFTAYPRSAPATVSAVCVAATKIESSVVSRRSGLSRLPGRPATVIACVAHGPRVI